MDATATGSPDHGTGTPTDAPGGPATRGRPRDPGRDAAILDAAVDVLAEVGYAALTMDAVALRARAGKATVYRRWASKDELVLDAVRRLEHQQVPVDPLPDTGSLRGDLLALFRPEPAEETARRDRAAAGLVSVLSHRPELAGAAHRSLVGPWAHAHRTVMARAVARGEVDPGADVGILAQVLPTMAAYRALVQRAPFDEAFLLAVVDGVLLPALRPPAAPPR
ncbi:TetR/AcrR family transcriptional regulator [Aquipuribacter hungaricus]|uniref:TetR/AcrR family transcriptional regulator n=1 Tax=Aquipuribacter hungaricus TaxID=545624 RepID=A0ABV7WAE5_9MICO